jgi:hypothetical protein
MALGKLQNNSHGPAKFGLIVATRNNIWRHTGALLRKGSTFNSSLEIDSRNLSPIFHVTTPCLCGSQVLQTATMLT